MSEEDFNIISLDITPNECSIERELSLIIKFTIKNNIKNGIWSAKYIVDSSKYRHIIELGTRNESYDSGENTFNFTVDKIDVLNVKRNLLLNVGLLSITLKDETKEYIEINIVTQVTKDKDGNLIRAMFNPLE